MPENNYYNYKLNCHLLFIIKPSFFSSKDFAIKTILHAFVCVVLKYIFDVQSFKVLFLKKCLRKVADSHPFVFLTTLLLQICSVISGSCYHCYLACHVFDTSSSCWINS